VPDHVKQLDLYSRTTGLMLLDVEGLAEPYAARLRDYKRVDLTAWLLSP
jgi:hypothetical protein